MEDVTMKKTYIIPEMEVVLMNTRQPLMSGSVTTNGLDGLGGYGGGKKGGSADSRECDFDDDF